MPPDAPSPEDVSSPVAPPADQVSTNDLVENGIEAVAKKPRKSRNKKTE
jgi:hypothetical protein